MQENNKCMMFYYINIWNINTYTQKGANSYKQTESSETTNTYVQQYWK